MVAQLETLAVPLCFKIAGAPREHSLWRDLCQRLSQDRAEGADGSGDGAIGTPMSGSGTQEVIVITPPSLSPAFLSPRGEGLRLTKWQEGQ